MIVGNLVSLRAVEREDLPLFRDWRNREDFRKHFREYRELNLDDQQNWFQSTVVSGNQALMFTIVLNDEMHTPIGCCGLCYINWVHRNADLSLYIGHDNAYIDQKGYAKEACELLFRYGFSELNLYKIWTEIYEFDELKMELYAQMGMRQDGLLRDNYFYNNQWWNSRILSILHTEYSYQDL